MHRDYWKYLPKHYIEKEEENMSNKKLRRWVSPIRKFEKDFETSFLSVNTITPLE